MSISTSSSESHQLATSQDSTWRLEASFFSLCARSCQILHVRKFSQNPSPRNSAAGKKKNLDSHGRGRTKSRKKDTRQKSNELSTHNLLFTMTKLFENFREVSIYQYNYNSSKVRARKRTSFSSIPKLVAPPNHPFARSQPNLFLSFFLSFFLPFLPLSQPCLI
ncbi:hypothetical protein CMEL01_15742 [Colletotrichum melonis]|uniref:Uncharacterized protein n=1 Tax=Colletotrichum melonis TaxID=1209925 RepID=A0AAI9UG74_9PEZI|nr:hypothetical protein CMEL01_15742 [Colletotrichum melonis]